MNQVVVKRKFGSLRFIGSLMKVFAWISIALGVIGLLTTIVGGLTNAVTVNVFQPQAIDSLGRLGLRGPVVNVLVLTLVGFGGVLAGILAYILFMAAGDQVHVLVETEHNSRAMVELMTRLVQLQTPLPPPPVSNPPAVMAPEPPAQP
jgi:hypothetical protein